MAVHNMRKRILSLIFGSLFFLIHTLHAGEGWWAVYFTSPGRVSGKSGPNDKDPEAAVIRIIDGARESVYCCFYDISSPAISGALVRAKGRGVDVRIVIHRGCFVRNAVNEMIRAGIPVVIGNGRGLMHNKFAVIDGAIVWTGSFNWTENDSKRNNNNALELHSGEIAGLYLDEFDEMFSENIFGNRGEDSLLSWLTGASDFRLGDSEIAVYFSPDNDIEGAITSLIDRAESSIIFMAFSFTSDVIGDAMIRRHGEGVRVSGIFERRGSRTRYSEYEKMKAAGLDVSLDRNPHLMHHKIIIIDGRIVIVGSYNFSRNASLYNDENIMVISNDVIAGLYLEEFERIRRQASVSGRVR